MVDLVGQGNAAFEKAGLLEGLQIGGQAFGRATPSGIQYLGEAFKEKIQSDLSTCTTQHALDLLNMTT